MRKLPIRKDAKVSSGLINGSWKSPFSKGWDNQVALSNHDCHSIQLKSGKDQWIWKPDPSFSVKNAASALQTLLPHAP